MLLYGLHHSWNRLSLRRFSGSGHLWQAFMSAEVGSSHSRHASVVSWQAVLPFHQTFLLASILLSRMAFVFAWMASVSAPILGIISLWLGSILGLISASIYSCLATFAWLASILASLVGLSISLHFGQHFDYLLHLFLLHFCIYIAA
jgi:hypothetical protein